MVHAQYAFVRSVYARVLGLPSDLPLDATERSAASQDPFMWLCYCAYQALNGELEIYADFERAIAHLTERNDRLLVWKECVSSVVAPLLADRVPRQVPDLEDIARRQREGPVPAVRSPRRRGGQRTRPAAGTFPSRPLGLPGLTHQRLPAPQAFQPVAGAGAAPADVGRR